MKVTLVHESNNGWVSIYVGDTLLEEGYMSTGDVLKYLIGKGSILGVEEYYMKRTDKLSPKTLTEFYKRKGVL